MVKTVSVKVKYLRKRGYDNLREWLSDNNELLCRHGRIFIDKKIFHYKKSEWHNPYKLKEYTLEESLTMYEIHLRNMLKDEECRKRFENLITKNELGCFCDEGNKCHREIVLKLLNELFAEI